MRVAVVDDEEAMRTQLDAYILQYAKEKQLHLEATLFASGDTLLENYSHQFDIIIFDIDMPGTNGLDTARKIRETDREVVILFITNIAQYAINGYEVEAVDYIIKPVGYFDFAMKFQKAVRWAEKNHGSQLYVDTLQGPIALNTDNVLYVEVMAHYLSYHMPEREYKVRGSMKEHEEALRPYHFARCHKSYLINLKHLKRMASSEVIVDDYSIPLGRAYKDALMADFMEYLHR